MRSCRDRNDDNRATGYPRPPSCLRNGVTRRNVSVCGFAGAVPSCNVDK